MLNILNKTVEAILEEIFVFEYNDDIEMKEFKGINPTFIINGAGILTILVAALATK